MNTLKLFCISMWICTFQQFVLVSAKCSIFTQFEKQIIPRVNTFCYIKVAVEGSELLWYVSMMSVFTRRGWILLCNTAADLLSYAILYLNAEDVGLLIRLKIKKRKRKKNKIKNNKKQTENNYKKNKCQAGIRTTIAWV